MNVIWLQIFICRLKKGKVKVNDGTAFIRLTEVPLDEIARHMSDPRVAEHMPLLIDKWDIQRAQEFVGKKEKYWQKDGLGHWAFLNHGRYVGWGGFQKEGDEWNFGLVLKSNSFGLGPNITYQALDFAEQQKNIPYVTFLLPPSRKNLGGLERIGAKFVEETMYENELFLKYRIDTMGE